MSIRAVCFDLDGTLLDGSGYSSALGRTCEAIALRVPGLEPDELAKTNQKVWNGYWPAVEEQWTLGAIDGATVSLEAWRRTFHACGLDDDELSRFATASFTGNLTAAERLFEDATEVLNRIAGGFALALITNGAPDTQREKLRHTAIDRYFDVVVISGEHALAKPDPAIFRHALNNLDVAPQEALHVGDSLQADVAGALNAGLTAVWLNRGARERDATHPTPQHEITSLRELPQLLDG